MAFGEIKQQKRQVVPEWGKCWHTKWGGQEKSS